MSDQLHRQMLNLLCKVNDSFERDGFSDRVFEAWISKDENKILKVIDDLNANITKHLARQMLNLLCKVNDSSEREEFGDQVFLAWISKDTNDMIKIIDDLNTRLADYKAAEEPHAPYCLAELEEERRAWENSVYEEDAESDSESDSESETEELRVSENFAYANILLSEGCAARYEDSTVHESDSGWDAEVKTELSNSVE